MSHWFEKCPIVFDHSETFVPLTNLTEMNPGIEVNKHVNVKFTLVEWTIFFPKKCYDIFITTTI
jgi:hypothetical protein